MAKKAQARRQKSQSTPAWAWLLAGLLVGALVFLGYRQYQVMMADEPVAIQPQAGSGKNEDPEKNVEPPASGVEDGVLDTDYSFYDVLPTQETVEVEDSAAAESSDKATAPEPAATPAEPQNTAATAPVSRRYLLQAGAFERSADADDLKARIALSGEAARVESAEVNGKTMYRVRLGPYNDATAAERARANLAGQGIRADSIAIQ
jgi:cell division protein FtsN